MRFYYLVPKTASLLPLSLLATAALRQSGGRVPDYNAIGWLTYGGGHQLLRGWAVPTEVQWRRTRLGRQQLLSRLGVVNTLTEQVQLSGSYAQLTTYPYGDYPTANLDQFTPENRVYEDITLTSSYGRLELTHRFRLKQRRQRQPVLTVSTFLT